MRITLRAGDEYVTGKKRIPEGTTHLCCGLGFKSIPALPGSLRYMACDSSGVRRLPELPLRLEFLNCQGNFLPRLPRLPASLRTLCCSKNSLEVLPALPDSLEQLFCSDNHLKELPPLPRSLKLLECSHNKLSCMPELPRGLTKLDCRGNVQLRPFELPDSLTDFSVSIPAEGLVRLTAPFLRSNTSPRLARMIVPYAREEAARMLRESRFDMETAKIVMEELVCPNVAAAMVRWHWLGDLLHLLPRGKRKAARAALAAIEGHCSLHVM